MTASSHVRWLYNMKAGVAGPFIMLGLFQAGATAAVKRGELLELSGGHWIPLASDKAMAGIIAIANEDIVSGDRAGYYEIIVPTPGDVFEFDLAVANDVTVGTVLYWSSSEAVAETGTHSIGTAVGQEHYPAKQGHLSDDGSGDSGTVIRDTSHVRLTILAAASYYAALQI